ncbi:MAG: hypothetical protein IJO85_05275 [Lachnospiraceae bacterium]|nr:hypothetical protein [Lachnospiraceae bacterium]
MEQIINVLNDILNPSDEFTPIPFWFFNDEPDEERIRKQLEDYVEKGVNGIVLHPRIGVPKELPYLSEEYFEVVRFIVKTADSLGMKIVLYDEGMYPSGSAHGMVVSKNPEFASKGITVVKAEADIPTSAKVITQFEDGSYLIYDFTHGTIRGIHFGEDDGEEGAPASADILNPEAVDTFIQMTHDQYYEHLKEYFGNTVIAFFTDEPSALGRNAGGYREWVSGMEEELIAGGGSLEELSGLFEHQENKTTVLYHKLIKKYLREIFYARLSNWSEAHGIALMGHPEVSDDVEEELYFHIPGQDLIMRRVSPETGGLTEFDSVQAKLSADIARHLGRRRNANECFGVCFRDNIPWYFTAADMKWYIDWLGFRGVNLFVPHAFYYSVAGARKEERPPDVGPNNIWWKHYRRFSDYMKRLSYLMTDSVNSAKIAVLCDNNRVPYKELAVLYENQIEFNYLPIALLEKAQIQNGKLCIAGYEYEAVLNVTDKGWNERLNKLQEESMDNEKLWQVEKVEELLEEASFHAVQTDMTVPSLRATKLQKQGVTMYLLSNEGEQDLCARVQFTEAKSLIALKLWNGSYKAMENNAELCLQPRETMLVIEDENQVITKEIEPEKAKIYLGDWTEKITFVERKENEAVYKINYDMDIITGGEYFTVKGEEMVECYCNGEFVDVSFWGIHSFDIGSYLHEGENEIKLVFTGNAANIYCDAKIPFGIS